jgi:chitinase
MSRKWTRWLAGAVAAATVVLGVAGTAAADLLVNPGFEAGNTSGWTCSGATTVGSPVHSGSNALAATPAGQDYAQCSQRVTVLPNSAYSLSAYVQGSYIYLGATGTGGTDPQTWTSSTGYSQLSTSFTTGASTTSVTVYIHGWYGQPTYYADDFVLSGPGGGGGTPTVPAAPTALKAGAATSSSVPLSWTAPSGDVSGYNVYQNGTKVGTASGASYTATGLAASTSYTFAVTAYNSAGESPKSNQVTATTTSGGGGNPGGGTLPAHVLTGYWQNFYNGAKALKLADVPTTYDLVAVAFADATGTPGAISFTLDSGLAGQVGGYTDAQFTADIATLHGRGQKVILSVGGQNGTISVGDSGAAANFANSAYSLIQKYGFDGIDIDLENGVNATYMGQALHSLASKVGSSLVVTLAPQTIDMQSTGMAYFQLALNIKDILTIVNMQYYNSGTMNGCDQGVYAQGTENFLTALACIQLQGGLRADQVGLGLPASGSAAGGGYMSPATVNAGLDCLAKGTNCGSFKPSATYPSIRGAMTWSINWDASNGYAFANTVHSHLGSL